MAIAKWSTPAASRGSNILGTIANSLANGSESSSTITYDNTTALHLNHLVTLKLASLTPSTGGSVSLRFVPRDGTDTPDQVGGRVIFVPLRTGTNAKTNTFEIVLGPFVYQVSIINNAGVTLPASGNELYIGRQWNEEST